MTFKSQLVAMHACKAATDWVGERDAETAWRECERSDWMLWLLCKHPPEKRVLVAIACDIARTVLRFVRDGEERPRLAIEAAERWVADPTEANRADAASASAAAAAAAAAAYAYAAAYAAASAAAYAYAAAYAAAYAYAYAAASAAAYAYAYAAASADAGAAASAYAAASADAGARASARKQFADIIRKHVPNNPVK